MGQRVRAAKTKRPLSEVGNSQRPHTRAHLSMCADAHVLPATQAVYTQRSLPSWKPAVSLWTPGTGTQGTLSSQRHPITQAQDLSTPAAGLHLRIESVEKQPLPRRWSFLVVAGAERRSVLARRGQGQGVGGGGVGQINGGGGAEVGWAPWSFLPRLGGFYPL